MFIACVVPIKGLTDLIRSLAVLRDQGLVNSPDVLGLKDHLPEYYELRLRTIEELNMGEYITFHGTRERACDARPLRPAAHAQLQ